MPNAFRERRRRRPRSAVKPHRSFDPRRVGGLEAAVWVAYYRREWWSFLRSAVMLTRHTFGLSWPATIYGAWLVLRANQLWAPYPNNDPDGARRAMERFYRMVAEHHDDTFDPRRASELEVEWWRVHREHQHDGSAVGDEAPLIAALSALLVQQGFTEMHGLQCGFCTPGMMLTARALLQRNADPSEAEIREAISGQICRCTGYATIVRSIRWAAEHRAGS